MYSSPLLRGRTGRSTRATQFAAIGWLARMAAETSCFEAQSSALRRSQLSHARRRQLAAWHELQRTERASLPPMLWIVAAERSPRLEQLFELREHASWPTGFRFATAGERWCLVVVPALPVERATLPLRAMGRGRA